MVYLDVLREKRVDGIIVVSEMLTEEYANKLVELKVPVILISTIDETGQFPHIKVNDEQAAYQATEYLISKGHKKYSHDKRYPGGYGCR